MNPIQLLFRLLQDHAHFEGDEYAKLKAKGDNWYRDLRTDDEPDNETHEVLKKVKKVTETWYMQTLNAILFIYLSRKIWDYLNPTQDIYEHQEEERNRNRMF